jgi:ketosteroid isomerase-like protein
MTDANVEIVRSAYDAFNRGDLEAGARVFDASIEWRTPANFPEAGTWRGEEEVRRGFAELTEPWDDLHADVQDLIPAGEGRVLALVRFSARGRGTGLDVRGAGVDSQVWTLRGGKVVSVEMHSGTAAGFEAVGLEDRG